MAKILDFSGPDGPKRFEFCFEACLLAGDGKAPRDKMRVRKEAKLFDALDIISEPAGPTRTLKEKGRQTIMLDKELYDLLVEYVDTAPWKPTSSQLAVKVMDWLAAAPEALLEPTESRV